MLDLRGRRATPGQPVPLVLKAQPDRLGRKVFKVHKDQQEQKAQTEPAFRSKAQWRITPLSQPAGTLSEISGSRWIPATAGFGVPRGNGVT